MYLQSNVLFPEEKQQQNDNTPQRNNSVSRLMRDLKEWQRNRHEFQCIDACPLEDNIYEWHCNISPENGHFKDLIFHIILYFTKKYPLEAPEVKLCTTIPHSNVFNDWICLDMIKRHEQGRYKGWTPCYSVSSILMQLQSFLFEDENIDQMGFSNHSVKRQFDSYSFQQRYLPSIKSFKCDKCEHSFQNPFPMPLSVQRRLNNTNNTINTNNNANNISTNSVNVGGTSSLECKNDDFALWDGIYRDLEIVIFAFFDVIDLMKLQRVAKRFKCLVYNSKIIQKDSIKCWFHRVSSLPSKELDFSNAENYKNDDMSMLLLGYGISPLYWQNNGRNQRPITFEGQLFSLGKRRGSLAVPIINKIGNFHIMQSVETTFDLLSSDAFENYNVRKTIFKDREFTHFMPLYINKKHGELFLKHIEDYTMKIWYPGSGEGEYHPWLTLQTIANMMRSLVVSVLDICNDSGNVSGTLSLHHSINVLEAFFRLHHTLLGFYLKNEKDLGPLLKHQIDIFFNKDENIRSTYRNKTCIPDFGIFLVYLTLWQNPNNLKWSEIATELLDETLTRQIKWVLKKHNILDTTNCSDIHRLYATWDTARVSRRMFMFNYFFFKQCCGLGNGQKVDLENKLAQYNENFGLSSDPSLPYKLQAFVKNIQTNVNCFSKFFQIVEVEYPGVDGLAAWLRKSMQQSEERRYHRAEFVQSLNTCVKSSVYMASLAHGFNYDYKYDDPTGTKKLEKPLNYGRNLVNCDNGNNYNPRNNYNNYYNGNNNYNNYNNYNNNDYRNNYNNRNNNNNRNNYNNYRNNINNNNNNWRTTTGNNYRNNYRNNNGNNGMINNGSRAQRVRNVNNVRNNHFDATRPNTNVVAFPRARARVVPNGHNNARNIGNAGGLVNLNNAHPATNHINNINNMNNMNTMNNMTNVNNINRLNSYNANNGRNANNINNAGMMNNAIPQLQRAQMHAPAVPNLVINNFNTNMPNIIPTHNTNNNYGNHNNYNHANTHNYGNNYNNNHNNYRRNNGMQNNYGHRYHSTMPVTGNYNNYNGINTYNNNNVNNNNMRGYNTQGFNNNNNINNNNRMNNAAFMTPVRAVGATNFNTNLQSNPSQSPYSTHSTQSSQSTISQASIGTQSFYSSHSNNIVVSLGGLMHTPIPSVSIPDQRRNMQNAQNVQNMQGRYSTQSNARNIRTYYSNSTNSNVIDVSHM